MVIRLPGCFPGAVPDRQWYRPGETGLTAGASVEIIRQGREEQLVRPQGPLAGTRMIGD
jgi:hypothetical protein